MKATSVRARLLVGGLILALVAPPVWGNGSASDTGAADSERSGPVPYKTEEVITGPIIGRIIAATAFAILVAGIAILLLKRYVPALARPVPGGGRIQVHESLRVSPRTTLYLVEVDGSLMLLGQSSEQLTSMPISGAAGLAPRGSNASS